MNLQAFITQALSEIIQGVNNAAEITKTHICFPTKNGENIHFDIAVTIEDSTTAKADIKILSFAEGGGNTEAKNSTTSRVSFSLLIPPQSTQ